MIPGGQSRKTQRYSLASGSRSFAQDIPRMGAASAGAGPACGTKTGPGRDRDRDSAWKPRAPGGFSFPARACRCPCPLARMAEVVACGTLGVEVPEQRGPRLRCPAKQARLTAVVDLPTPPLMLYTPMVFIPRRPMTRGASSTASEAPRPGPTSFRTSAAARAGSRAGPEGGPPWAGAPLRPAARGPRAGP